MIHGFKRNVKKESEISRETIGQSYQNQSKISFNIGLVNLLWFQIRSSESCWDILGKFYGN